MQFVTGRSARSSNDTCRPNARAPILFFQTENDYDLSPTRSLSAAMRDASKEFEIKIYPAYGKSPADGHIFAYFGSSVWAADVFRFLQKHCGP
jgi:hypothetical protein